MITVDHWSDLFLLFQPYDDYMQISCSQSCQLFLGFPCESTAISSLNTAAQLGPAAGASKEGFLLAVKEYKAMNPYC